MNNRLCLGGWLALLLGLLAATPATAQIINLRGTGPLFRQPSKQSHHDLPGGLDIDNPQQLMAERLQGLHELHQLQDQVQDLLKDPDFVNNIKQRFSESQLRQLREKMLKGEGLSQDRNWNDLLQEASSRRKLDQRQIDILRRWAERAEQKQSPTGEPSLLKEPDRPPTPTPSPSDTSTSPPSPSPAPPEPSLFDRLQAETTRWLMEHVDDVGGDVVEALIELGVNDEGTPLNELLQAVKQPDLARDSIAEQAAGLSGYVPKVGEFLHEQRGAWDEVRSLFRDAPTPSLPNVSGRSASALAAGDSGAPLVLSLLLLGTIVLLLWKTGLRLKGRSDSDAEKVWRLGSWPVAPGAVATRQDVIRAFEYLVLLCLGPAAATHHHRDLAERLAEQDGGNPARRQAAELLAWLYEQARYAPADESLSPGELSDARNALSLLAGVTAA